MATVQCVLAIGDCALEDAQEMVRSLREHLHLFDICQGPSITVERSAPRLPSSRISSSVETSHDNRSVLLQTEIETIGKAL